MKIKWRDKQKGMQKGRREAIRVQVPEEFTPTSGNVGGLTE